jgi:hypothetical protein
MKILKRKLAFALALFWGSTTPRDGTGLEGYIVFVSFIVGGWLCYRAIKS